MCKYVSVWCVGTVCKAVRMDGAVVQQKQQNSWARSWVTQSSLNQQLQRRSKLSHEAATDAGLSMPSRVGGDAAVDIIVDLVYPLGPRTHPLSSLSSDDVVDEGVKMWDLQGGFCGGDGAGGQGACISSVVHIFSRRSNVLCCGVVYHSFLP